MTTTNSNGAQLNTSGESKHALTVGEFCFAHGKISRTFFYKLVRQGLGPRLLKIGNRTLITVEAAAEWRLKMENRTADVAVHDGQ